MAKKKISRKELLKGPDEFMTLSSRIAIFASEHVTGFKYIGIGICAAVLIYLGINTYVGYVNKKGQAAYNLAFYSIAKTINPEPDEKDFKESEKLFQEVIDKYGRSKAGRLVPAELAHLRFREKKYDETISLYREYMKNVSANSPYMSLALLSIAACYEEKGDLQKAIETLSEVKDNPGGFFRDQAMLGLARVYRLSGKTEKARESLKEFIEKFNDSPFLPIVKAQFDKLS